MAKVSIVIDFDANTCLECPLSDTRFGINCKLGNFDGEKYSSRRVCSIAQLKEDPSSACVPEWCPFKVSEQ